MKAEEESQQQAIEFLKKHEKNLHEMFKREFKDNFFTIEELANFVGLTKEEAIDFIIIKKMTCKPESNIIEEAQRKTREYVYECFSKHKRIKETNFFLNVISELLEAENGSEENES